MMKTRRSTWTGAMLAAALLPLLFAPSVASAHGGGDAAPEVTLLASGLEGASGGTIGPDGALYVGEGTTGEITRIDTRTGAASTFATGLPPAVNPIGGVTDVAFVGRTAYALVTLVDPGAGGAAVSGIYRIDDADSSTVVADLGAWSIAHPPTTEFFVPSGVQFAFEPVRGGFVVTDGHHNRVLLAGLSGRITQLAQFENTVPTGLDLAGARLYVAEAGPTPHLPEEGRIVVMNPWRSMAHEVAAGAPLLVDVEAGRCGLYGLSQGAWTGGEPGSPASPDTGSLVEVTRGGGLSVVVDGLDRPTSVYFARDAAFVIGLAGEVWRIDHVFANDRGAKGGCRGHGRW
ncbi:ScyD/ScyE family protein [Agromyces sp. NPDC058110]|uniref:ScyD/ScyE family protein n=1 Tax=Agromyces sp. NPDC058110 TaxID=3346345 RepID=UPI0036D810CF